MTRLISAVVSALGVVLGCLTLSGWGQDKKPRGEKYALLIGVRQYPKTELRNLNYSEADIEALAQVFRNSGYRDENLILLTQKHATEDARYLPTSTNIRKELRLLLQDRDDGDMVIVGFAGHGVQFRGDEANYFCPADAHLSDKQTLISMDELYQELGKCKAGFKLLLVDACRNDPQSDHSRARAEVELDSATRIPRQLPPGGVAAFFSCSSSEKAYESPTLKHGVFFHYVVNALKGDADFDKDGEVSVEELAGYTKKRTNDFVRKEYQVRQMPQLMGDIRGVISLARVDVRLEPRKNQSKTLGTEVPKVGEKSSTKKSPSKMNVALDELIVGKFKVTGGRLRVSQIWEFTDDGKAFKDGNNVGSWKVEGRQIRMTYRVGDSHYLLMDRIDDNTFSGVWRDGNKTSTGLLRLERMKATNLK